jgi:ATP-dependent DNA helicase RecQ
MLVELRKKISEQEGLPPYVIFQDISLDEMAIHYPIAHDELLRITGVGSGKAKKFGEPFLALIQRHVESEGIERASDLLVRSASGRSSAKVQIIQHIDRKVHLEDMARSTSLGVPEILAEIEGIVAAGTRVNLDYIIDEALDEDSIEELFDFFKESDDDGISAVLEEFGDVYSEEELRLARIKFLSEFAN